MKLKANTSEAIAFLTKWDPSCNWTLTAIGEEGTQLDGGTFTSAEVARQWIDKYQGTRNLYFSVNPTFGCIKGAKAGRKDISTLAWLHVDIDMAEQPKGRSYEQHFTQEMDRILALLHENRPDGIPEPTAIVFSGGGYQAFWRLSEPLQLDGTQESFEAAKRWNLHLEKRFGADHCHNVDRIMRLPGTINIPNKRKVVRGRVRKKAELVSFSDKTYDLSVFPEAEVTLSEDASTPSGEIDIPMDYPPIDSPDVLDGYLEDGQAIPNYIKVAIVQGKDPEKEARWPSRSEAVFSVVCALIKGNVPLGVIYSILTDDNLRISDSVLDKGARAQNYALRQIERAHAVCAEEMGPRVGSPEYWLRKLNDRYALISSIGGKCKVMEITEEEGIQFQNTDGFTKWWNNKRVPLGDGKEAPIGKWWLAHPRRRSYMRVFFDPSGTQKEDQYNLWQGFAVEPSPEGDCSLYLEHVKSNICRDNFELYEYLLNWMAHCVQHPEQPGQVAVVLRGRQGTGKGVCVTMFGALFGRHFRQVSNPKHLTGNFNAHLQDCCVLYGDEAFFAGDKSHEGVLKTMVTEDRLMVERKGVDVTMEKNRLHIILASNSDWVVPAGLEERRFFTLDVSDQKIQDVDYFTAITNQMYERDGLSALLYFLKTRDLSEFNVRNMPKTEALRQQKMLSFSATQEWWYSKLVDGRILPYHDDWVTDAIPIEDIMEDYLGYTSRTSSFHARAHANSKIGRFLREVTDDHLQRVQKRVCRTIATPSGEIIEADRRMSCYRFPTLQCCREVFDIYYGGPWNWPDDIDDETAATQEYIQY